MKTVLPIRGFLLHISHYDPSWCFNKENEEPFSIELGFEIIETMFSCGFNTLIIDCADGVSYSSHPELKRNYTVPMLHLEKLSKKAKSHGIEVIPKLNFSQSRFHRHNEWFYPYNEIVDGRDFFDSEEYWKIAFELIDELIEACEPVRFFHIGMDEDHSRSHVQFAKAISTLRNGLRERDVRAVIWKDTRTDPRGLVFSEKHLAVEDRIAKDIVQMIWDYSKVVEDETFKRLVNKGIEVWGSTGKNISCDLLNDWRKTIVKNDGKGIIITDWLSCTQGNREKHLDLITKMKQIF